jgi:hypothetical protein
MRAIDRTHKRTRPRPADFMACAAVYLAEAAAAADGRARAAAVTGAVLFLRAADRARRAAGLRRARSA